MVFKEVSANKVSERKMVKQEEKNYKRAGVVFAGRLKLEITNSLGNSRRSIVLLKKPFSVMYRFCRAFVNSEIFPVVLTERKMRVNGHFLCENVEGIRICCWQFSVPQRLVYSSWVISKNMHALKCKSTFSPDQFSINGKYIYGEYNVQYITQYFLH